MLGHTVKMLVSIYLFTSTSLRADAQQFFNLTAEEVRIDSVLPTFCHAFPLGGNYADSVYTVEIAYPEFIDMSEADVRRCQLLTDQELPEMPVLRQTVAVQRKQGVLTVSFVPLVCRDGKLQKLVSFSLHKTASPVAQQGRRAQARAAGDRYAENSVLRSGSWAKIRVPSTGFYQLTESLIRKAGFSSLDKVRIYGYGGARQPEVLTGDYLTETDDLSEVPTCTVDGKRIFYAVGPVSWNVQHQRVRNPYSNYGYYLLTESDDAPLTVSAEELKAAYYPAEDDYCSLYEIDNYAWYEGGANLYDSREMKPGNSYTFTVNGTGASATGTLTVVVSGATTTSGGGSVSVTLNGEALGKVNFSKTDQYTEMNVGTKVFTVSTLQEVNEVILEPGENAGVVRLDYISTYCNKPRELADLSQVTAEPEYDCNITNQNHHADPQADMVIIIPTSQKLKAQAERLKSLHEQADGLSVSIVPADELYNEFSSGTPDVNAYRRYMKMLYDRAKTDAEMPRYLLLFGDCVWDNRLLTSTLRKEDPNDLLLCYESENSFSHTLCYVTDDYFCLLDDGEGGKIVSADIPDVAVGRITARADDDAAIVVDKIYSYVYNDEAGSWQNVVCFMGDDGNKNQHMSDADAVAKLVEQRYPALQSRRIMWDAYTRVTTSTGNRYPDVVRLIKEQMQKGALMMNYSGHGRADAISHEYVLTLSDFTSATSLRLPLWVTASCDIMPFDGTVSNIGESAIFNQKGGAIAFYGTTRTVYQDRNRVMNLAFTKYVFEEDSEGRPIPVGEAARLAKAELITEGSDQTTNRLQYSLLGDPAIRLTLPKRRIEIESINDVSLSDGSTVTIKAGSTAKVTGRVLNEDGTGTDESFQGTVTTLVRDVMEEVVCRLNDTSADGATTPFVYYDRVNNIYSGSNSVIDGRFTVVFAVPKDIKYSTDDAMINAYAVNDAKDAIVNGVCNSLSLNGTAQTDGSELGPSIYCYLNSPSFTNGGDVNPTPYFIAELSDEDGINAAGSGIGHDLQLIIDGDMTKTYTLNNYFQYDFGSYTRGTVSYNIPKLSEGKHKLMFRAWDVLNNSSTAELTFNVVEGLEPSYIDVVCLPSSSGSGTSFHITHDRGGTAIDIRLDIYDSSGRQLWTYNENEVATGNTYTIDWDLTIDGGRKLNPGLYLYKLSISSEGSPYGSVTKKLIVLPR